MYTYYTVESQREPFNRMNFLSHVNAWHEALVWDRPAILRCHEADGTVIYSTPFKGAQN